MNRFSLRGLLASTAWILMATPASADYLGTETVRLFVDPSDIPVIADGYDQGDVVSYILEATPRDTGSEFGHGSWMTFYVPAGIRVVSAAVVQPDASGNYYPILPEPMDETYDECGKRGCVDYSGFDDPTAPGGGVFLGNGYVNRVQQDTGIFYSTDLQTQLVVGGFGTVDGSGVPEAIAYNEWDFNQTFAFGDGNAFAGNGGKGNTPVISVDGGVTWAGTGAPVAGPHSYYTNDYDPTCDGLGTDAFAADLQCVGPWERIALNSSQIGYDPAVPVAPCIDANEPDGDCENELPIANTAAFTSDGWDLSQSPLPVGTNALRYTQGQRAMGELEYARVTVEILDADQFTSSFDGCTPTSPPPCNTFCIDAIPGDTSNVAAKDNNWRYYEPEHLCVQQSASGLLFKQAKFVNGQPSHGQVLQDGDVVGYEISFTNTSGEVIHDIFLSDAPVAGTAMEKGLLEPAISPQCPYSSYDGSPGGPTYVPGSASNDNGNGPATWSELPTLAPGETVTVFMCAVVDGNTNEFAQNEGRVRFALTDNGVPVDLFSRASGTLASSISGTVYFDADASGNQSLGDEPLEYVTVQLWIDEDGDGMFDPAIDTFVEQTVTGADGSYLFNGVEGGDYIVVEIDPDHLTSTGDIDTPSPLDCNSGNTCNAIAVTIPNGGRSTGNDFFDTGDPLAAVVHRFEAFREAGSTAVEWSTASEAGTIGFRLERLLDDRWVPVEGGRVPGVLAAQGGTYRVLDPGGVESTAFYRLIETEVRGSTLHGPFEVRSIARRGNGPASGARVSRATMDRIEQARRQETPAVRSPRGRHTALDDLRAGVRNRGLVVLAARELAAHWQVEVGQVQRWILQSAISIERLGRDVPWFASPSHDAVYFFGEAADSLYTLDAVYRIEPGRSGRPISLAPAPSVTSVGPDRFLDRIRYEQELIPALTTTTETEVDHWHWAGVRAGNPTHGSVDFDLAVPDALPGTSRLAVDVAGASDGELEIDHVAEIAVDGRVVGTTSWGGLERHRFEIELDRPLQSATVVTVTGFLPEGGEESLFFVEGFDLDYPRRLRARDDRLDVRRVAGEVTVDGFTQEPIVLEVSDSIEARLVAARTAFDGASWSVSFAASGEARYYLSTFAASTEPHRLEDAPVERMERDLDYIAIAGAGLLEGARAMADHRASDGLRSAAVEVQQIYDEYSHGEATPWAINAYLRAVAPRYALLVGAGTYDPRDLLGHGDDRIAPVLIGTPDGLTSADNLFGDTSPIQPGLEVAIGRLPVLTDDEVFAYLEKLRRFEELSGAWRDRAFMITDNADDSGNYGAMTTGLLSRIPERVEVWRSDLDGRSPAEVRAEIKERWNAGSLVTSYMGHGGVDRYAAESLLSVGDADELRSDVAPVALAWSCVIARHELAAFDSLGEVLVTDEDGGASAVWAPSGLVSSGSSYQLGELLLTALYDGTSWRIGDLVRTVLGEYLASGGKEDVLFGYTLLGDPALHLVDPPTGPRAGLGGAVEP